MPGKPLLVVIYPYKFHEFVWRLLELDHFKSFSDILVLDISPIATPSFAKHISADRSEREEIITCRSINMFIDQLVFLRKRAEEVSVTMLNEVIWTSPRQFFCNCLIAFYLRGKKVPVFDLFNGGVILDFANKELAGKPKSVLAKLKNFFSYKQTFSEFTHQLMSAILNRVSKLIPYKLTHRLVAGTEWKELANRSAKAGLVLVPAHSHDFSNYLLNSIREERSPGKKTAVLLDSAGPAFNSDTVYTGFKISRTSEVWYPAVTHFFEALESYAKLEVEIAGHYKSAHSAQSPYFGGRNVRYGCTYEMVKNSECVMTINSTAISYAVIFKKPIIFIYSNQLKEETSTMEYIYNLSSVLGTKPVNIDEPVNFETLLRYDSGKYEAYEKRVLTSDPTRRPNVQIILEDIMGVDTRDTFKQN